MKWIFAVLMGFCLASAEVKSTMAQTEPAETKQALSTNESTELRLQIKALTELLQSKVPKEKGEQRSATESNKTVADVLDKALDLVSGSIATIAAGVEKAAPHVWRIMIRQQYANAVGDLILPWGLFIVVLIYYKVLKNKWPKPEKTGSSDDITPRDAWIIFVAVVPLGFGIIFGFWGIQNLTDSAKILINPEYYAIKDLIAIILQNNPLN